jgi:ABC-type lipoprotein release transport system permease subunit
MDRPIIARHVNLCVVAVDSLIRNRVRFVVTTLCLVVAVSPLITALGVLEGLRFEATISVQEGADIYVSADQLGANGPVPEAFAQHLIHDPHVTGAATRVVGRTYFADRLVAVLGLNRQALGALESIVRGSVPRAPGEVIAGQSLADRFKIRVGMPFSLTAHKSKVFKLVGILEPTCLWSADLLLMDHEDANEFFRMKGYATQLLFYGTPESSALFQRLSEASTDGGHQAPRQLIVQGRGETVKKMERAYDARNGIFTVLFCTGMVLAIAAFLITSGLGMGQMRKEIGVLKALGWSTQDLLEKVALENLAVCLIGVAIAVLVTTTWMKGLNGVLFGQFYVSEVGLIPQVPIPFRILPLHGVWCLLMALVATEPGSLVSTAWRACRPPLESARYQ